MLRSSRATIVIACAASLAFGLGACGSDRTVTVPIDVETPSPLDEVKTTDETSADESSGREKASAELSVDTSGSPAVKMVTEGDNGDRLETRIYVGEAVAPADSSLAASGMEQFSECGGDSDRALLAPMVVQTTVLSELAAPVTVSFDSLMGIGEIVGGDTVESVEPPMGGDKQGMIIGYASGAVCGDSLEWDELDPNVQTDTPMWAVLTDAIGPDSQGSAEEQGRSWVMAFPSISLNGETAYDSAYAADYGSDDTTITGNALCHIHVDGRGRDPISFVIAGQVPDQCEGES